LRSISTAFPQRIKLRYVPLHVIPFRLRNFLKKQLDRHRVLESTVFQLLNAA